MAKPVFELLASDRLHLWTTAAGKRKPRVQLAQRAHQCRAMVICTHFAGDEINRHGVHSRCSCRTVARPRWVSLKRPPTGQWLQRVGKQPFYPLAEMCLLILTAN